MKLLVSCTGHEQVFASPGQRSDFSTVVPEKNSLAEPDSNPIHLAVFLSRGKTGYSSVPPAETSCIAQCAICVLYPFKRKTTVGGEKEEEIASSPENNEVCQGKDILWVTRSSDRREVPQH